MLLGRCVNRSDVGSETSLYYWISAVDVSDVMFLAHFFFCLAGGFY